jgi:hypothetical protein
VLASPLSKFNLLSQINGADVTNWSHQKVVRTIKHHSGKPIQLHIEFIKTSGFGRYLAVHFDSAFVQPRATSTLAQVCPFCIAMHG